MIGNIRSVAGSLGTATPSTSGGLHPQLLVNRQLQGAVADHLPATGAAAPASGFSPTQAATHILGDVKQALQNGAPGQRGQILAAARKAVARGLQQAAATLRQSGQYDRQSAAHIAALRQRLEKGLEALGRERVAAPTPQGGTTLALLGASDQISNSLAFEVTTRDGDTVTINISRSEGSTVAGAMAAAGGSSATGTGGGGSASGPASAVAAASQSYQSDSVSISVQGNLDSKERKAIEQLATKLDGLANDFFNGNVQGALSRIQGLNYNRSELAGFSLNLQHSESYSAIAAYRSTAQLGDARSNGAPVVAPPTPSQAQALHGFMQDIQQALQSIGNAFPDPNSLFSHLFDARLQLDPRSGGQATPPGGGTVGALLSALTPPATTGSSHNPAAASRPSAPSTTG